MGKEMALDIVANGLDLAKWKAAKEEQGGGDDKGFSLSSKLTTATAWAATRAALRGSESGVVIGADDSELPPLVGGSEVQGFDADEKVIRPQVFNKVKGGVFKIIVGLVPPLGGNRT